MKFDTSKLKNNKFFFGDYTQPGQYKGWFIGSFFDQDHPCHTEDVEVFYIEHEAGWEQVPHYHAQKVEIIILLTGKAKYTVNDQEVILKPGNFLFVDINNVIAGEYLEKSTVIAIHSPSIVEDKIVVEK